MMKVTGKKLIVYLIGTIILAIGLTLNSKVTLGVSPILSSPYAISEIFGLNYPDVIFFFYCILIALQLFIHICIIKTKEKEVLIGDVLQIVVSLIFTRIMNVVSMIIPVFEIECQGFFSTIYFRLIMLALAIVLIGLGASLTLNMHLIPNPGDGIVATLAQAMKKPLGTAKNIVDFSCVFLALCISLISAHKIVGVGLGTLIAMLGVGRVINIVNHIFDFSKF